MAGWKPALRQRSKGFFRSLLGEGRNQFWGIDYWLKNRDFACREFDRGDAIPPIRTMDVKSRGLSLLTPMLE
jgi:hypothetical protein